MCGRRVRADLTWRGTDGLVHLLEELPGLGTRVPSAWQPRCDAFWLRAETLRAGQAPTRIPTCLQCLSGQGNTWLALARLYDAALVPAGSAR